MKVDIQTLVTNMGRVVNVRVGGLVPSYGLKGPRYGKLTIGMTGYKGLAFVTFAKLKN